MPTKDFSSNASVGGIPTIPVTQKTAVRNDPGLLGQAAQAGIKAYDQFQTSQAERGLLGSDEDGTQIGGVDVPPGMTASDLAHMAQGDESVSLRKIKKMREQGLVSHEGAQLLAANAVQREIAKRPSKAREIQAMAGRFFGQFGEGQDLLDQTAQEKKANELTDFIRKETAKAGLFSLDASGKVVVTPKDMDEWRLHAYSLQKIDITKKTIEMRMEQGKVVTSDVEQYGAMVAHEGAVGILGKINAYKEQNQGMIMKPEEMDALVAQTKIDAYKRIDAMTRRRTADGSALVTPEQVKGMRASVDKYYDEVKSYIKSGSFADIMKTRREALSSYTAMHGIMAMPLLSMAEGAAPGSSKYLMDMLPRLSSVNAAQREVMFESEPHLRLLWNETMAAHAGISGLNNLMKGFVPDFGNDPIGAMTTTGLAKTVVRDPASREQAPDLRSKAFDNLIGAAKTKPGILADIRLSNFGDLTPEQEGALANVSTAHIHNLKSAIRDMGREPYEVAFQNGQFVLTPGGIYAQQYELMGSDIPAPSRELRESVNAANEAVKTLSLYERSSAMQERLGGVPLNSWVAGQLDAANAARAKAQGDAVDPRTAARDELYRERMEAYKQDQNSTTEGWLKKMGVRHPNRAAELDGIVLPEYEGVKGRWVYNPYTNIMKNLAKE